MCVASPSGGVVSTPVDTSITGSTLSTAKAADTVKDKETTTKKVSSLRVPMKNKQDTKTTGINTADSSAVGLNIPT